MYIANMGAKPVQISMDTELLRRIDADPETLDKGRSAFVRSAIELYLKAKERQEVEARIRRAYSGRAAHLLEEITELMDDQAWPDN
ncbi:MAG: ribbon-helix-helix protein, CopG family [Acidobacteriota bacterium]